MPWLPLVVDGHCDTLTVLEKQKRGLGQKSNQGQLDLVRMATAGVKIQFFAAFIAPSYYDAALKMCLQLIDLFHQQLDEYHQQMQLILSRDQLQSVIDSSSIGALLTVEGGEALAGDIAMLRNLYRLGVRSLTLTWNHRNQLGDGVGEGKLGGGLSRLGQKVVQEMNRLGMLVDVSHLHEKGFWHVAAISKQPFAATHANSKSVCNHVRNLNDEQIQHLAKTGGVMGLTFVPDFIATRDANLDQFIRHIDYIAARFGVKCIGLGSDFDGMDHYTPGLSDVTCLPRLAEALSRRGYGDQDIADIMGGNWLRLLRQILK